MLDFYGFGDSRPWPDDLPADRLALGSLSPADFQRCAEVVRSCLPIGIEVSSSSHWIVPAEELPALLGGLRRARLHLSGEALRTTDAMTAIVVHAKGSSILAVCD